MSTFLAEKRNKNKTVLDWHQLEAAVTAGQRLKSETDTSKRALERALAEFGDKTHIAQINERVIAIGTASHIELAYLEHSPGTDEQHDRLKTGVAYVYQAAAGQTQYKVSESCNGHFMNRWLPFNASDRKSRSIFQTWMWAYGAGGMYRSGVGPLLQGIGIEACQRTHSQRLARINAAGEHVSDAWRKAAVALLEAFDGWRDTFPDTRVILRTHSLKARDAETFSVELPRKSSYSRTRLLFPYAAELRLRLPYAERESGRFCATPDLAIAVVPQPLDLGYGPPVSYVLLRRAPESSNDENWPESERPAACITTRLQDVMHVARELSAASVFIPAL